MIRTIEELGLAAAFELEINANHYRHLYVLEDHGQNEQATTYEMFIARTRIGLEWATAMMVV